MSQPLVLRRRRLGTLVPLASCAIALCAVCPPVRAQTIGGWSGSFWRNGVQPDNAAIHQLLRYEGDLYAMGDFAGISRAETNGIARWDGAGWLPVGAIGCSPGGSILCAVEFDGDLIVGGIFTTMDATPAANVARWDGTAWHALGDGFDDEVHALHVHDGVLLAGGRFSASGSQAVSRLARWNGSSWEERGEVTGTEVNAIASWGTALAIGGSFTAVKGAAVSNIAVEPAPGVWSDLQGGTDLAVDALTEAEGMLVAGGRFMHAGSISSLRAAGWNGTSWQPMPLNVYGYVYGLSVENGDLYATGSFYGPGKNKVARWDGNAWHSLDDYDFPTGPCRTVAYWQGALYVGGHFDKAGRMLVRGFVRWNGTDWEAPESAHGLGASATTFAEFDGQLVFGCGITTIDGERVSGVAAFDGVHFHPLGQNLASGTAALLVMPDGRLVAGGGFYDPAPVAVWNPAIPHWDALGSGLSGDVAALCWHDGALYAGGELDLGPDHSQVARLNGDAWEPVGAGPDGRVRSLTVWDDDLIVGGEFTTAGSVAASHVARWTGTAYEAMGDGVPQPAWSLHSESGTLAAGLRPGGVSFWDGADWTEAPGLPTGSGVYAVRSFGGKLVAAGQSGIHALGDGVWSPWPEPVGGGWVYDVFEWDGDLWAGGSFVFAGAHSSGGVARWQPDDPVGAPGSAGAAAVGPLRGLLYRPGAPLLLRTTCERADVFDVRGSRVRTLHGVLADEDSRTFQWDGRDAGGRIAPRGVYFLRTRDRSVATKLVLAR